MTTADHGTAGPGAPEGATVVHLAGAESRMRDGFLRWQCRIRQHAARMDDGRPGDGCVPALTLPGEPAPMGHVVTVFSRQPQYSKTAELRHMVQRERDEAKRRESAIRSFSETWYQHHDEFSDTLTSTFRPGSPGAKAIVEARRCKLRFEQFRQVYEMECVVRPLGPDHPLREATFWHNLLFNPQLPRDSEVVGFEPDWLNSTADPPP